MTESYRPDIEFERETTPNDPFAWLKRLEAIDEAELAGEDKELLDRVIPEEERDEFDDASVDYSFCGDDESAITKGLGEFGTVGDFEAFVQKSGTLTLDEQLDQFTALSPRQKAAAWQIAWRQLHSASE